MPRRKIVVKREIASDPKYNNKIVGKFKAKLSKLDRASDALNYSLALKYNSIVKDGVKAAVRLTNMKEEVNIDLTDSDSADSEESEEESEPQQASRCN